MHDHSFLERQQCSRIERTPRLISNGLVAMTAPDPPRTSPRRPVQIEKNSRSPTIIHAENRERVRAVCPLIVPWCRCSTRTPGESSPSDRRLRETSHCHLGAFSTSCRPMLSLPNSDQRPTRSSGHKVFCLWPHSLQAYSTRPWSTSALMRLDAPHLPHLTSSRVLPCVMVTFRAIASLTKRSDSWRIASFDIAGARGFLTTNSPFSEEVSL
jgi:hypothetical protein